MHRQENGRPCFFFLFFCSQLRPVAAHYIQRPCIKATFDIVYLVCSFVAREARISVRILETACNSLHVEKHNLKVTVEKVSGLNCHRYYTSIRFKNASLKGSNWLKTLKLHTTRLDISSKSTVGVDYTDTKVLYFFLTQTRLAIKNMSQEICHDQKRSSKMHFWTFSCSSTLKTIPHEKIPAIDAER